MVEIQINETGIQGELETLAKKFNLSLNRDTANFDGAMVCNIIGAAANIALLCIELYKIVKDHKKVDYKSDKLEQEGLTLDKAAQQAQNEQ